MAMNHLRKIGRVALWFSPVAIVVGTFIAMLPWLKQQHDAIVMGIAAAASIFVMGYSLFLAARANSHLDEVQIAGQRFASVKGVTLGGVAAVLVLMFPPAMNALVAMTNVHSTGSPEQSVKLGIYIGLMLVILLQTLATAAVSIWWDRRLRGPE